MAGFFLLTAFWGLGHLMADRLFAVERLLVRIWAGILIGLTGMMWAVVPFAFLFGFSLQSHLYGLFLMGAIVLAVLRAVSPPSPPPGREPEADFSIAFYAGLAVLTLIIGTLMFLQTLYPKNGGLAVGAFTYGDLNFHLGIVTSLAAQKTFPPEYSVFPGARLTYSFLVDSLSSSLTLFGVPLRWAVLLPGFLLTFTVVAGFLIFAREVLRKKWATVLAAGLFFFNGGLGFMYFLEGSRQNPDNFWRLFNGFYYTPANLPEKNLAMWNVIGHVLIPQRTSLAGWAVLFFVCWLLYRSLKEVRFRYVAVAGVMTGLLPMIHTVSFFVTLIIALVWAAVYFRRDGSQVRRLKMWLLFFGVAVVLSLPQLWWLSSRAAEGHFLRFHFNWANEQDPWIWFWVKNTGVVFLLILPALLSRPAERLRFYSPAVVLFALGETFLIGPWSPDNNKIFFIWLAFSVILIAEYLTEIYRRLEGMRGRGVLLGTVIFVGTFTGVLTVGQGFFSSYELFPPSKLEVARFVKAHTPPDALFVSSDFYANPVSVLAGRNILRGYQGWLWSHGIDGSKRGRDIERIYQHPEESTGLQKRYGIDYIYLSDEERRLYKAAPDFWDRTYPKVYSRDDVRIYAVSDRARDLAE